MGYIYRKKKKNGRILLGFLLLVCVAIYVVFRFHENRSLLNTQKILQESVLKDKVFSGKTTEIKADAMKAFLMEEHSNPIVSVSFKFLNSGTAYETEKKSGITRLLSDLLLSGTEKYDFLQFHDLCEEYGIKIGYSVSDDDFSGYLIFPKMYMQKAVDLFVQSLNAPRFDEEYIQLEKQKLLRLIEMQPESLEQVAELKFRETFFHGHSYARNPLGNPEFINQLTSEDLYEFMHQYFTKSHLVIGIAGDIKETEAKDLMKQMFGSLPDQGENRVLKTVIVETRGINHEFPRDSAQIFAKFVTKGTTRQSDDFYPLYIANHILGGSGLNSILSKKMREDKGLTYGIYTYLSISDATQLIEGYFSSTPENFATAKKILLNEWQTYAVRGITEDELKKTQKSLIDSYNLRFSSISNISDMLVDMQKYNLGVDFLQKRNQYIRNVSLKEVNDIVKAYYASEPDFITIGTYKGD